MSLRKQLLAISLLLLSLPWAGCEYLREMDRTLRAGQGMAAQATARAIAAAAARREDLLFSSAQRRGSSLGTWYIPSSRRPLVSDGYDEDWRDQQQLSRVVSDDASIALRVASVGSRLFIYVEVNDETLRFQNPSIAAPNGDRLELGCTDSLGALQQITVTGEAPGGVRGRYRDGSSRDFAARVRGALRERRNGFAMELQMPLGRRCERLGLQIIDATDTGESVRFDSRSRFGGEAPWLVYRITPLNHWLAAFGQAGTDIEILDPAGFSVGAHEAIDNRVAPADQQTFWLLRWLYRSVLSENDARVQSADRSSERRTLEGTGSSSRIVEATAPIRLDGELLGTVRVRESTERYLALTDKASGRLLRVSSAALGIAVLGLLTYASVLSWRIRRLRDAASKFAKDPSEAFTFPRSRAGDELGDLSRSYADLLRQIGEYTNYLRGLARTLSHELRTPIAVVGSSLDNLGRNGLSQGDRASYTRRARDGLSRLTRIVSAMSEASRIEESLLGAELAPLDAAAMLRDLHSAYASTFAPQRFTLVGFETPVEVIANGELIAQALDKLTENAVSFAAVDTPIALGIDASGEFVAITVTNRGPALPDTLQERLFEPMVSVRQQNANAAHDEASHLGIGLHIAQSIARAHGGKLLGENLPDGSGVRFSLCLPKAGNAALD